MAPQTTWQILVAAFPRLLSYGIRVTIPLAFLSFALGLVIAVIVASLAAVLFPVRSGDADGHTTEEVRHE